MIYTVEILRSAQKQLERLAREDHPRIIYEIHDKKLLVLVVTVGHRKEIYR